MVQYKMIKKKRKRKVGRPLLRMFEDCKVKELIKKEKVF